MKAFCLAAFLLLSGCRPEAVRSPKLVASNNAPGLFTDSAIYRAQCKEADSVKTLTSIPRKCTPRDQRLKIY